MYKIVDREYLDAINTLTNESMVVLDQLNNDSPDLTHLKVDKQFLVRLLSGYLFFYNKSIEHSIMPKPANTKQFREHIH